MSHSLPGPATLCHSASHSKSLTLAPTRWSMFLSEYNFQLDYTPGTKNPADFPSHHPNFLPQEGDDILLSQNKSLLTDYHLYCLFPSSSLHQEPISISSLSTFNLDNSELLNEFKDNFCCDIEWRDTLAKNNTSFSMQNDLVYHNGRLFIPLPLCTKILYSHHDSLLSGHPGHAKTYDLIQCDFSWPWMQRFICLYVTSCEVCQCIKNRTHKPYRLLQPLNIPDRPWYSISMDFIVKLPPSHGHDSIWVICN